MFPVMTMKKRAYTLFFLLISVFLIILLLLFFRPSYVRICGTGVQMKPDGTIMLQREIALKGWHLRPLTGQKSFKTSQLHVEGFHYSLLQNGYSPVYPDVPGAAFTSCVLLDQINKPVSCQILWSDTKDFCLIHMDGYFFIWSENRDYRQVLDRYLPCMTPSD